MKAEYDDGRIAVFCCTAAELAEHVRGTVGQVDALIVDAPYSERTHAGHDDGTASANQVADWAARTAAAGRRPVLHDTPAGFARRAMRKGGERRAIEYAPWSPSDVAAFVAQWSPLTRGWIASLTDHVLVSAWSAAYEAAGRYAFAPIACVEMGGRIRLLGDGPPQWACFLAVGRPSSRDWIASWQESRRGRGEPCSLKGAHVYGRDPYAAERLPGGKPVDMMRAIVRDYSHPGDLVTDTCLGGGTTAVACRYEGRRFIGCDQDPKAVETTIKRLRGERLGEVREDMPADADHALALFGRGEQ